MQYEHPSHILAESEAALTLSRPACAEANVACAALGDADTQIGRYTEACAAADRLSLLRPGVPAFTRAVYVCELRGDTVRAEAAMRLALEGYATVASHQIIEQRYNSLGKCQADLEKHVGKEEANSIVVEIYTKVVG